MKKIKRLDFFYREKIWDPYFYNICAGKKKKKIHEFNNFEELLFIDLQRYF